MSKEQNSGPVKGPPAIVNCRTDPFTSSGAATSFFQQQGLLLNRPPPSNAVAIPQVRATNRPDPARQEKFDLLTVKGMTYTNVLLRTINASEGALHHDGGLERIRLGDLPEAIRVRFCDPQACGLSAGMS